MAPSTNTSEKVTFHETTDGVENFEKTVALGDGLRFCGRFQPSRSAFIPRVELVTDDLVLIGPPPMGSTNEDLKAGGIVGAVKLRDVQAMAGSGDWKHVTASGMKSPLSKAAKAKADRSAPKDEAKPKAAKPKVDK